MLFFLSQYRFNTDKESPKRGYNLTCKPCCAEMITSRTCASKSSTTFCYESFHAASHYLRRMKLVCSGVLLTHQWGHHPFARWRDNDPQVWLAAPHSHVPSRGRWRLGRHDFTQAVAARRAEEARRAPGVNKAIPCRDRGQQKRIIKSEGCD